MSGTSRRRLLQTLGMTLAATSVASRAMADFAPAVRYPDTAVRALDPSFSKYIVFFAAVEQLYTGGMRYTEGPVYFGDGRFLLWTDIPNNRIMKWEEATGAVSVFREPSNYANGLMRDHQGRLIAAEHGRKVTRTEYDGSITVLADSFEGKPLNSPNDVVVASDESIWFTDPPFGIGGNYSGVKAKSELPNNLYRLDPNSGEMTVAASDIKAPNGLCFSPDERLMYVVDSGAKPVTIRAYDVSADRKSLTNGRVFFTCGEGEAPDGIRCDVDGNVWAAYGAVQVGWDGILVMNPEGKAIGHVGLPERAANLCFGGPKRNRLFMVTGRSLYSLYVNTQGVAGA